MASQVLSGASNPVFANNTGQNVRVKINFIQNPTNISWGNATLSIDASNPAPKEIFLSPNQIFSAVSGAYNILIIKESGN